MFGSLEPTSYDLNFSIGRIPVRVSPWFWAGAAILGYNSVHLGVEYLLVWILVVFVSILVHELGHAIVAQMFGYPPRILMYQFGGLAMYEPYRNYTAARAIAISFAGPFAGFALYGLVMLLRRTVLPAWLAQLDPNTFSLVSFAIIQLSFVNLWWGIMNLLPVLPLDGGQISREVCLSLSRRNGLRAAMIISFVVAAAVAIFCFSVGRQYAAILFAMLAAESMVALQNRQRF